MIIAHPPCTYLTVTGNRWFDEVKYGEKAKQRQKDRYKAIVFFMQLAYANADRIAIENPVGCMNTSYRKADQIIQPWQFGHPTRKTTFLWLKGLPLLNPTEIVEPIVIKYKNGKGTDDLWHIQTMSLPPDERSRERSKTFPGIAAAMADQWGSAELQTEEQIKLF